MRSGIPASLLNKKVSQTTDVLHVFADGTLGNDSNSGGLLASGTGGSFSYAGGVVTATLTGAVLTAAHIGKLVTLNYATSSGNSISALITGVPAPDQVTYANANGVTEAFTGDWWISSPKKTVSAALSLIPFYIKHVTILHLSGVFVADAAARLTSYMARGYSTAGVFSGGILVIDGGTSLTTVADNGGSPWTADIHSTTSIGLTTAGWTIDAYAGYFVEIVNGACAGQHRTIQGNTATTITPTKNWSGDPGVCSFRISRPTTELQSGGTTECTLVLNNMNGDGRIYIQNMYLSGASNAILVKNCAEALISFSHCIGNGSSNSLLNAQLGLSVPQLTASRIALSTMALDATSYCAPSQIHASGKIIVSQCKGIFNVYGLVAKGSGLELLSSSGLNAHSGLRIWGATFMDMDDYFGFQYYAGYASTKICGSGLSLINSNLTITGAVDISNCSSHGITCKRSFLNMTGIVIGSGNGGAGVYAYNGSVINIKHGSPPTLTGSVGDLTTDGTTPAGTWAGVDGGERIFDLNEGTLIKEVA